jgi:hypothetical protein
MGTRGFFPRVKRPGREVDHSPPSSAEVKEYVELYLLSPTMSSWRGAYKLSTGTTLPFLSFHTDVRRTHWSTKKLLLWMLWRNHSHISTLPSAPSVRCCSNCSLCGWWVTLLGGLSSEVLRYTDFFRCDSSANIIGPRLPDHGLSTTQPVSLHSTISSWATVRPKINLILVCGSSSHAHVSAFF